jgi:uncharacterized protein (TIGR03000 family)
MARGLLTHDLQWRTAMRRDRTLRWTCSASLLALLATSAAWSQAPAPATGEKPARLVVRLPEADATLTVDGEPTRQTGTVRRFVTPPLEPGRRFSYTLVAVIKPNNYVTITRTRKVHVQAGEETEADLRNADPALPDNIVIRYVPTPPEVVDAMLKLARVGKDDVVYDLGCGDGRIVITAVKKFGARRGVGVDLDPQRLKESRANARKAGVEDKVQFRQENVLKLGDQLANATVVTLYMSDNLNLAVRPELQKYLKPGSRIVSHRFTMGDWKPDRTETITGADGDTYLIHLWTIREK